MKRRTFLFFSAVALPAVTCLPPCEWRELAPSSVSFGDYLDFVLRTIARAEGIDYVIVETEVQTLRHSAPFPWIDPRLCA